MPDHTVPKQLLFKSKPRRPRQERSRLQTDFRSSAPAGGIVSNPKVRPFHLFQHVTDVSTLSWSASSATKSLALTMTPSGTLANICDSYRVIGITLSIDSSYPLDGLDYAVAFDPTGTSISTFADNLRYSNAKVWTPSETSPTMKIVFDRVVGVVSGVAMDSRMIAQSSSATWSAGSLVVTPSVSVTEALSVQVTYQLECINPRFL